MSDDYDGPERRKGYEDLKQELDDHADAIALRFSRWFRGGLIAMSIMAVAVAISLIGFGYALNEIQDQRREVCESQNRRHDNTIKAFHAEEALAIKRNPQLEQRIRASSAANIRIINALLPKLNCDSRVQTPLK